VLKKYAKNKKLAKALTKNHFGFSGRSFKRHLIKPPVEPDTKGIAIIQTSITNSEDVVDTQPYNSYSNIMQKK
jgi:hypothetical protein